MKIWIIQTGEILPLNQDARIMRIGHLVSEILQRGHSVIWWTTSFDHFEKKMINNNKEYIEVKPNFKIYFLKALGYKKNFSSRRFIDHMIVAKDFVDKSVKIEKPDVILSAIPEQNLAYFTVKYAKRNNIPIAVDLRDPWPDFFINFIHNPVAKFIARIALYRDFKRARYVLNKADSLISVMNSLLSWGQKVGKRTNMKQDRVFYLGSSIPQIPNNYQFDNNFRQLLEIINKKFVVLFIGAFNNYYNPKVLIEAAKLINEKNKYKDKISFVLAGDGNLYNDLINYARDTPNIYFTKWINNIQIAALLEVGKIGIIPAQIDEEAFPNKAFTYLSGGVPLVSSTVGELWEIIEQEKIGLNFHKNDSIELSDIIIKLYENYELQNTFALNAKKIFLEKFESSKIYSDFAKHIENVKFI